MEGVIELGKLRRIQAVLNQYIGDKRLNINAKFDWEKSMSLINKGKGQFVPVCVNDTFDSENFENIATERTFIEHKLKTHFLKN